MTQFEFYLPPLCKWLCAIKLAMGFLRVARLCYDVTRTGTHGYGGAQSSRWCGGSAAVMPRSVAHSEASVV